MLSISIGDMINPRFSSLSFTIMRITGVAQVLKTPMDEEGASIVHRGQINTNRLTR